LALASKLQPSNHLSAPTTIVSIGTGGTAVGLALTDLIGAACGGSLPDCIRTLVLEADVDPRDDSILHQRQPFVAMGHAGLGSVLANGREKSADYYHEISKQLKLSFAALQSANDHRFPLNRSGVKRQNVLLIAPGSGATAGGAFDSVLTAIHAAAAKTGTEQINTVLVTFGAEMAHKDVTREQDQDRPDTLRANHSETSQWIYRGMSALGTVRYTVPNIGSIRQLGSDRIIEHYAFDQSNGNTKLHENAHLGLMVARCLYFRFFTSAGLLRAGRFEDEFQTNVTKQRPLHRPHHSVEES
jgi:hypothetical protein